MGAQLTIRKLADRPDDPDARPPYPLRGVQVVGEPPAEHAFKYAYLATAAGEGWATFGADTVVLHTVDGDVTYRITERTASGVVVELEKSSGRKRKG